MELVILVGIAASGKTTWSKMALPKHVRISLDDIKQHSRELEDQMVENEFQKGNNIVIDDTNLRRDIRKRHISVASRYGASIKVVFFDVDISKAHRQNSIRDKDIPYHVLDVQKRNLEIPAKNEGIDLIQIVC